MQHTKFKPIYSKHLKRRFYVYKATKHHSISNGNGTANSAAEPGNIVAMDSFFNMFVFTQKQFIAAFGQHTLDKLEEE